MSLEDLAVQSLLCREFGTRSDQFEKWSGKRIEMSHLPCPFVGSGSRGRELRYSHSGLLS